MRVSLKAAQSVAFRDLFQSVALLSRGDVEAGVESATGQCQVCVSLKSDDFFCCESGESEAQNSDLQPIVLLCLLAWTGVFNRHQGTNTSGGVPGKAVEVGILAMD